MLEHLDNNQLAALQRRFFANVDTSGGLWECWLWTASRTNRDYGQIGVQNRQGLAHRVVYELYHGPIPDGMCVMHVVCDNPQCCNPTHLKLGTQAENMADKVAKGRQQRGENVPTAKLTVAKVLDIRRRMVAGERRRDIARTIGISENTVSDIKTGRSWAWLPDDDAKAA
jgi:Autographiviridae endonuclease